MRSRRSLPPAGVPPFVPLRTVLTPIGTVVASVCTVLTPIRTVVAAVYAVLTPIRTMLAAVCAVLAAVALVVLPGLAGSGPLVIVQRAVAIGVEAIAYPLAAV